MANDVYRQAHETLSTMVSGRAATRMLRHALRGAGCDANDVSAIEMRDLLMDSVLADLERILPRDGVKRTLKALSKELLRSATQRDAFSTEADVPSDLTAGERDDPSLRSAAFLAVDDVSDVALEVESGPPPAPVPPTAHATDEPRQVRGHAAGDPVVATDRTAVATAARPRRGGPAERREPLDEAVLRSAVMRFAHLDYVTFVGAVRRGGAVVYARGGGIDVAALARRAYSTLALIGRGGTFKTFTLQTGDALLVLAPMGDDLLIVAGTPNLNLGAVFAARTALEEEL